MRSFPFCGAFEFEVETVAKYKVVLRNEIQLTLRITLLFPYEVQLLNNIRNKLDSIADENTSDNALTLIFLTQCWFGERGKKPPQLEQGHIYRFFKLNYQLFVTTCQHHQSLFNAFRGEIMSLRTAGVPAFFSLLPSVKQNTHARVPTPVPGLFSLRPMLRPNTDVVLPNPPEQRRLNEKIS